MTDSIEAMAPQVDEQELAEQLVEQARADGVELIGPGGLLTGLTSKVFNTALEVEMAEHLGYDKHDPAGRNGENSRNASGRRRCSPSWGRCQLRSRGTGLGALRRGSCASGSVGWTGSRRSCCR